MLKSEFAADAHLGQTLLIPRWLRVKSATLYSGISRAQLYLLLAKGTIKSAYVKTKGNSRGIRLIDRLHLDEFLESRVHILPEPIPQFSPGNGAEKLARAKKVGRKHQDRRCNDERITA